MGGDFEIKYYMIELHYDNPRGLEGLVFFSEKKQQFNLNCNSILLIKVVSIILVFGSIWVRNFETKKSVVLFLVRNQVRSALSYLLSPTALISIPIVQAKWQRYTNAL